MTYISRDNLLIIFSFIFFLTASAFTLAPEGIHPSVEETSTLTCWTCDGSPSERTCEAGAQFCGFTQCESGCNLVGDLCGSDCGDEPKEKEEN